MDPTQQAASQIIKGGTVTALTVSIKICLRDNKFSQCNQTCVRGNYGLKLQNSTKLPDIHARLYYMIQEKLMVKRAITCRQCKC